MMLGTPRMMSGQRSGKGGGGAGAAGDGGVGGTFKDEDSAAPYDLSLRSIYLRECKRFRCKANSYLLKTLSETASSFDTLQSLDLSLNFVGRVGLRPVLAIIRLAPGLKWLSLADNWLNNESARELVDALYDHRGVSHLDLSRNPISHSAGKMLSDYASHNPAISTILLEGTLVNPALIRIISQKTARNGQGRPGSGASRGHKSKRSGFPAAIPRHDDTAYPSISQVLQVACDEAPSFWALNMLATTATGLPAFTPRCDDPTPESCSLDILFAVARDDRDPGHFQALVTLSRVAQTQGLKLSQSMCQSQSPSLSRSEKNNLSQSQVDLLPVLYRVTVSSGQMHQLPALSKVFKTTGLLASTSPMKRGWYAMRLVWTLVQKEAQSPQEDWSALSSVLNLVSKSQES
eukprot:NODE_1062_length_1730_cov_27.175491_g938_i0.p1 GENE.NODE_1062_length_1730_cov_27.175491_g938_i0~~NODE_1062_length_1730_cov_27.175491_g938_i0.p1  ORF type:complete len:405 (-),score=50.09 NODE_1062_length_1730_cov_27.175491_g938_i0:266-1480(-)